MTRTLESQNERKPSVKAFATYTGEGCGWTGCREVVDFLLQASGAGRWGTEMCTGGGISAIGLSNTESSLWGWRQRSSSLIAERMLGQIQR